MAVTASATLPRLPPRPRALQGLSLYGFPDLTSLDGIGQWDVSRAIELFDCPLLTGFAPLALLPSVERISLGLFSDTLRSSPYQPA